MLKQSLKTKLQKRLASWRWKLYGYFKGSDAYPIYLPQHGVKIFGEYSGGLIHRFVHQVPFEEDELAFVREVLQPGDTFIDVGANIGLFSFVAAKRVGRTGRVISFEPSPNAYNFLLRGMKANGYQNIEVHQVALTNREGTLDFLQCEDSSLSSFTLNSYNRQSGVEKIQVKARRFDALSELAVDNIHFLKLDVEGGEILFLEGARVSLAQFPHLILMCELSEEPCQGAGHSTVDVYDCLVDLGFQLFMLQDHRLVPAPRRVYDYVNVIALKDSRLLATSSFSRHHSLDLPVNSSKPRLNTVGKAEIRLGIITDGTPVSEEVLASGMCRVNTRLVRALSEQIAIVATTIYANAYNHQDIAEEFQDRCVMVAFPRPLLRIAGRFFPQLRDENTAFRFMLPRLVRQLHKSQADWLLCPCGVDPSALGRGFRLAQASGLPLAVYLVDDFLSGATLSGNKDHLRIAQQDVPQWLPKADKIFAISEGLRHRLQELYNLDSIVLPLPYELPREPVQLAQNQEQIIFVGNLSHFYVDGLRQLATILDDLNKEGNRHLTLRLTSSNINSVNNLIGKFDCLKCQPCLSSKELYAEIASSLLCFAPYSFDKKYKTMVSSSFPSKMLDYLAVGKFIVNYGPEYSSSISYFKQHELLEVLCKDDIYALRDIILRQLSEKQDHSEKYRALT